LVRTLFPARFKTINPAASKWCMSPRYWSKNDVHASTCRTHRVCRWLLVNVDYINPSIFGWN